MADYVILGRVEKIGPQEFCATVSAVPAELVIPGTSIETKTLDSHVAAVEFIKEAAIRLGGAVVTHGDCVVGLVPDDWEGWGP